MIHELEPFLSGAIFAAETVVALLFWPMWQSTRDKLFVFFSAAFLMFAIERLLLPFVIAKNETHKFAYLIRLIGFLLIIIAIADRNKRR